MPALADWVTQASTVPDALESPAGPTVVVPTKPFEGGGGGGGGGAVGQAAVDAVSDAFGECLPSLLTASTSIW